MIGTPGRGRSRCAGGMTLVELLIGVVILLVVTGALFGAVTQQTTLNEHSRNMSWAMLDADRIMERLRQLNTGCATPTALASGLPAAECGGAACASWDAWLAAGGGGKNMPELMVVSTPTPGTDPLSVTVAVCWRHRDRTIGECNWNGAVLTANPGAGGNPNVTESPAMLSTMITCRPS